MGVASLQSWSVATAMRVSPSSSAAAQTIPPTPTTPATAASISSALRTGTGISVAQVCVVPVPDEMLGERAAALVVASDPGLTLEAVTGFRRLKGHADMPTLVAALRARDQRIGLDVSVEHVA